MSFNIGSQQGNINNVSGDQTIHGGQHGTFHDASQDPGELIARLREALDRTALSPDDAATVRNEMAGLSTAVTSTPADHPDAADRLARITHILTAAGALSVAAEPVTGTLVALAQWLGSLGVPVLRALGQ
ncbi:hypothetical protein ACFU96_40520 [Streptomyces sp. NPDC057620]|uniref:hypothetical protein n=1 Tax=Streptomyces sp. NPDC057620 TaxID=3346185 RepID=UPI0036CC96A7